MYFSLNAVLAVMLVMAPLVRRYTFGLALVAILASELWLRVRKLRVGPVKPLWVAVGLQSTAFIIWVLDLTRVVCAPASPFQGHAAWHLLGAGASYFLWRSLDVERAGR